MRQHRLKTLIAVITMLLLVIGPAAVRQAVARPAIAATPSGTTLSQSHPTITYDGVHFTMSNPSGQPANNTPTCNSVLQCDNFALNVDLSGAPANYAATHSVNVSIAYPSKPGIEYDLYIFNAAGGLVASTASGSDPTSAVIPAVTGAYTVTVVPFAPDPTVLPTSPSYTGTIALQQFAPPAPVGTQSTPGFTNYSIPRTDPYSDTAGEPSIGADWKTGAIMYKTDMDPYRVIFDDSRSPATATWIDRPTTTTVSSFDPILFVDHNTNRTFVSDLLPNSMSQYSFSDDDGQTYMPGAGFGIASGVDHQTIGGGPFAVGGAITQTPTTSYPDAVYYCSQDIADALCALSRDGGLTYTGNGTAIPIYNLTQCGGLHGQVKVAPDGTVYVPNKSCGSNQGMAVSTNNGLNWTVRTVPDSTPGSWDPSIGIGQNDVGRPSGTASNTIYYGYDDGSNHAQIAVSHDRGLTWSRSVDVGAAFGIQNTAFPTVVTGDDNRAAYAFLGSPTAGAGGSSNATDFNGVWHLYIAYTYDGGATWKTVDATPTDPVQRGPICNQGTTCSGSPNTRNLLDFIDSTVDKQGRVLVGYADGCIDACVSNGTNTMNNGYDALATIARQTSGLPLFSQYDPSAGGAGGGMTNTPVPSATSQPANTPVPATSTAPPVPPVATSASTNTPVPPVAASTSTNTPVPPTSAPATSAPGTTATATTRTGSGTGSTPPSAMPGSTGSGGSGTGTGAGSVSTPTPSGRGTGSGGGSGGGSSAGTGGSGTTTQPTSGPYITVSPGTARPGTTVTVHGYHFGSREQITLALNGSALATQAAVITTAGDGSFTATFVAGGALLNGANTVAALGNRSGRSAVAGLTGLLPVATQYYIAGGVEKVGEHSTVDLLNKGSRTATVRLAFYLGNGHTLVKRVTVPAATAQRFPVDRLVGRPGSFGLAVQADQDVAAQLDLVRPGKDGDTILGNTGLGTTWYLAEGYTGLTFGESVALLNPGARTARVALELLAFGGRNKTVTVSVGAHSHAVVDVRRLLPGRSLSVVARSTVPVVVERTLTFGTGGYGLTARAGINVAAASWVFAEGTTTNRFQTFLTVLNPNDGRTRVTAMFFGKSGRMLGQRSMMMAPRSRGTLLVNKVLQASGLASVVMADRPVVVERPEYFGSPNAARIAGSDVFGRNGAAPQWSFPAGNTAPGQSEFLLLFNPTAGRIAIDVTLYGSEGPPRTQRVYVPARVRSTLDVHALFPRATRNHGVTLRAVGGTGFVAEQTLFATNHSTLQSTQGLAR